MRISDWSSDVCSSDLNWRFAFFGALLISGGLAGGLVWQAARGTITPWVVEVDKLRAARAVAAADGDYRPTDPQIAFPLARFTEHFRSVPADPVLLLAACPRTSALPVDHGPHAPNDTVTATHPFPP